MSYGDKIFRVFVSSTSEDLINHRAVASACIQEMHWYAEMMEHFETSTKPTVAACMDIVGKCELFLLIVAWRQGWVPSREEGGNGTDSITALELAYARQKGIPVVAFMASDNWPRKLCETEETPNKWITQFRRDLNQIAKFFEPEGGSEKLPQFQAIVIKALADIKIGIPNHESEPGINYFGSARAAISGGECVPFVGPALFGTGPLSADYFVSIITSALKDAGLPSPGERDSSLATVAEYYERYFTRNGLLSILSDTLLVQSKSMRVPPVYKMIVRMPMPPLIISSTFDDILEKQLEDDNRPFVTLSHIIRSSDKEEEARKKARNIVLLRKGKDPEFVRADRLLLRPNKEVVIYKLLGSPLLHDQFDQLLKLDTVVITESDHLTFLRHLPSQDIGFPNSIKKLLSSSSFLFLGCSLDVWHYRLIMQVLHVSGILGREKPPNHVIRQLSSQMERMTWEGLSARRVVEMDPNEFARRVMEVDGDGEQGHGDGNGRK